MTTLLYYWDEAYAYNTGGTWLIDVFFSLPRPQFNHILHNCLL